LNFKLRDVIESIIRRTIINQQILKGKSRNSRTKAM